MDYGDYDVHDYRESQSSYITGMGSVAKSLQVTFWVGQHGPYKQTFIGNDMSPDNVVKFVQGTVADLRKKQHLLGIGAS